MSATHRLDKDEFLVLIEKLRIDPVVAIDSTTELTFAMARRTCINCTSKEKCRRALCRSDAPLSSVAPFCPNTDVLVGLLCR